LGLSKEEIDNRFDRIAAFADIGNFLDSPVKHYSSGMFARLAFSVAIHVDPEILIVDEILAVGDASFQRRCLAKFYEIRQSGCSILFVSHDQYQIKSVCQRALYLERGKQKMFGVAGTVIDEYVIDTEKTIALPQQVNAADARSEAHELVVSTSDATERVAGTQSIDAVNEGANGNAYSAESESLYRIVDVVLLDEAFEPVTDIRSGQTVYLKMRFRANANKVEGKISFVFNLYRHDGLYVCGSTTVIDGILPYAAGKNGDVVIKFPEFPLRGGLYKWRVAINDDGGFIVHAEAKDVCEFRVVDDFNAVGLVNLRREWYSVEIGS
jgi:lipopolysaccharide transport system ATP-binding protein